MGGEVCRQKGRERGPWFEIECVKEVIISKEAKGQDVAFERNLLRAWAKYPGGKRRHQRYQAALTRNPNLVDFLTDE